MTTPPVFGDIRSRRLIVLKGMLFALLSVVSLVLVSLELKTWAGRLLLLIAIWAACRTYYFAFYVLETYVDPSLRYTGLIDLARNVIRGTARNRTGAAN